MSAGEATMERQAEAHAYQCSRCGYFLFETALTEGRIEGVLCMNRRCNKRQIVYLGPRSENLRPSPRAEDAAYSAAS